MTTMNSTKQAVARPARPAEILPYSRQSIDGEDIYAVVEVLRRDWLTQGPNVGAFERALSQACSVKYAVAVSSGTAALHLACLAAGLRAGDLGVTSPITFVASANCIAYAGGIPCFADIDPATVTLDPAALDVFCKRWPPKVIIPVDFSGQPADLPAIHAIAKRYGALVIEDAAHALGASYEHDGSWHQAGSCTHSEMAVLSFHPVKHITTGEGGAILTNSTALYEKLLDLRSHGITRDPKRMTRNDGPWYYEQQALGFNYRITDFQCALGLFQLKKLAQFVEHRRHLVNLYREQLAGLEGHLDLLVESAGRRSSYHLLVVRLRGGTVQRRRVYDLLCDRGIRPQVHYIPVHLQPWYRDNFGYKEGDYPRAETYYAGCLSLPLFPAMKDSDVNCVITAVREAINAA